MNNTESKRNKLIPFIKRFSFSTGIIFIATYIKIYWSMGEFSDHMSSGCMECGFFEDALLMALITGFLLSAIFSSLHFIKQKLVQHGVKLLLLMGLWIFWNYSIFVDRESSWSTYDFTSEIHYTLSLSLFPVILLGVISVSLLYYQEAKAG
nr:hypothetical protein [uncultured Chryseobacterium sp.]